MASRSGSLAGGNNGFKTLNLSEPVYKGIVRLGFRMPTPVQRKSLPVALSGVDTIVMSRTGSGKTCAFLIPLLEKLVATPKGDCENHVRGLVLSPTRELSVQTLKVFRKLAFDSPGVSSVGIHGGEGMEKQFHLLASKPDVIFATPGRLAHHLAEIPDFKLSACMTCILDEADRLLEMGFSAQIRQIARTLPGACQKLLFSATLPKMLVEFTKAGFAVDPTVVRLDKEATVSADLRIAFITCRSADKDATLLQVLHRIRSDTHDHAESRTGLTLIFAATRHHVEYIATLLRSAGIEASMIYGSLDQEAREANLAAFRSRKNPILVVTDVAARGIDVPLIDHVVHYHMPPSPKLFIHRSGRCARAGRVGFCWGLVEPDELAYMIDLHLFLGRRPSPGVDEASVSNGGEGRALAYSLNEMTPEVVHYGSVPESILVGELENLQRIVNSEFSGSVDAESLRSLAKVCSNAMKQYRRTRVEASREGVRRAKVILEGERLDSGQRIGTGSIPPHPIFRGVERGRVTQEGGTRQVENETQREEFLRAVSNFRPKETVFEAFAAGGSKDIVVSSQVDKGKAGIIGKRLDSSNALTAMKDMRREMRISRDKGASLVVAGSTHLGASLEDAVLVTVNSTSEDDSASRTVSDNALDRLCSNGPSSGQSGMERRRISRVERRRLKTSSANFAYGRFAGGTESKTKRKRVSDFRDSSFFIENEAAEEAQRAHRMEAALQPSSTASARGSVGNALRVEEAMLDILGDERDELVRNQRLMRWDKSRRKYMETTVGTEIRGDSKSKRMRLENGTFVRSDKMKLGELYEKWQAKTKRSIGRNGVFDEAESGPSSQEKRGGVKRGSRGSKDEMKSAVTIKKERGRKHNLKIKNMKKADRRALEQSTKHHESSSRKPALLTVNQRRERRGK